MEGNKSPFGEHGVGIPSEDGLVPDGVGLLEVPWFRRRVVASVFPGSGVSRGRDVQDMSGDGDLGELFSRAGRVVSYRELGPGEARELLCRSSAAAGSGLGLEDLFSAGSDHLGLSFLELASFVDHLEAAFRRVVAGLAGLGFSAEMVVRASCDIRLLCFRWILDRTPAVGEAPEGSSAWDLVEAFEGAVARAPGSSLGESLMVWLEVLRPGAIWSREIPAGALDERPVFRYRTALPAGGVPDDFDGGSAPLPSSGGGGFWSGLRRALGDPSEGSLLGRPPGVKGGGKVDHVGESTA